MNPPSSVTLICKEMNKQSLKTNIEKIKIRIYADINNQIKKKFF